MFYALRIFNRISFGLFHEPVFLYRGGWYSVKLEDVKTLWPILTAVVVLSGFYYTTQLRLNQLESDVTVFHQRIEEIEAAESSLAHELKRLQKKVNRHVSHE